MNTQDTMQVIELESINIELIKQRYPDYYRVWKSMLSNYGKTEVSVYWRGTLGLMVFIEDTIELTNSPTKLPQYADSIKLKRLDESKRFYKDNVYWKVAKVATTIKASRRNNIISPTDLELKFNQLDDIALQVEATVEPEDSINKEYRRIEDKESRLEELFTKSMSSSGLSKTEQDELDVLSRAVVTTTDEIEIEEFYNKRWSDL